MPTTCCYAIIPDGDVQPAALFDELEDAMTWGLHRYGNDAFQIRYVEVVAAPPEPGLRVVNA